jgi:hypothetical protein
MKINAMVPYTSDVITTPPATVSALSVLKAGCYQKFEYKCSHFLPAPNRPVDHIRT